MKLLVTGAAGFIGRYVVSEALRRGHDVRALVRPAGTTEGLAWASNKKVEVVRADLRARKGLESVVDGVDTVAHLAVSHGPGLYGAMAGTVVATENLLDAMREAEVGRIVLVSTFAVYDYRAIRLFSKLNESAPLVQRLPPRDIYSAVKLEQERLVVRAAATSQLKFTIVRPGAIYGREQVWTARLGLKLSEQVWVRLGSWARLPLSYVENCAEAIVMCAEQSEAIGEIFNVVDDETPTQRAYIKMLRRHVSPIPHILPVPYPIVVGMAKLAEFANRILFRGQARMPQIVTPASVYARFKPLRYTNKKLKERIGWSPRHSLPEALKLCFPPRSIDRPAAGERTQTEKSR